MGYGAGKSIYNQTQAASPDDPHIVQFSIGAKLILNSSFIPQWYVKYAHSCSRWSVHASLRIPGSFVISTNGTWVNPQRPTSNSSRRTFVRFLYYVKADSILRTWYSEVQLRATEWDVAQLLSLVQ
jgi:hypothetical protein